MAVQTVTTVENSLYGIAAGHQIELTLVYLSRWEEWEARLPLETQQQLNASTYHCGSRNGRSEWPANMLNGCNTASNWTVNVLTQQVTAIILENREHFESVFPSTSAPSPPIPPSPLPPTPVTPTTAPVSIKATLAQTVTYSISVAQYAGQTKEAYDFGFASFLGIYDSFTNSYMDGCTLQGIATPSRRGSQVVYTAGVIQTLLAAATSNANSATATSELQAAVNSVIAAAYRNAMVPGATISAITKAVVSVSVDTSGVPAGFGYISQAVVFSSTVDYSDGDTRYAYDKGYGNYLGIYSPVSQSYVSGNSVGGVQVGSSRRSSTTISWLATLTCDTVITAYHAAKGKDLAALKQAIQDVIVSEYASLGTSATPSSMAKVNSQAICDSYSGSNGLSGGDIAGIVVGSIIGVALIAAIIYFCAFKKISAECSDGKAEDPNAATTFTSNLNNEKEEKTNDQAIEDSTVQI